MTDDADSRARRLPAVRRESAASRAVDEWVAVEEPLEIRLGAHRLLVTMRTPGDDLDLARGLLFTDGFVERPEDVVAVRHCDEVEPAERGNVVTVALRPGIDVESLVNRRVQLASAACGVCGRRSLDELRVVAPSVPDGPLFEPDMIVELPARLRRAQPTFDRTGGLHAAGLFDASGKLLAHAEDIGRHNAVDKVVGAAMRFTLLPLHGHVLLVSGRAGFEIAQKGRRAGISLLAAISAPSTLAIEVCREGNLSLIGFLREGGFNVYCGEGRVGDGSRRGDRGAQ